MLQYRNRYEELKTQLQLIGFVSQGSVQTRKLTCGNPDCRCRQNPKDRHGPYHYWTRKRGGKTVGLKLSEDQSACFEEFIENNRRLERILREMRVLSARALALSTGRKIP